MSYLKNGNASVKSLMIALCLMVGLSSFAQDKSPATTYNEGLALLKDKNYEEGLVAMEEALALATEANNEQIIGLANKNGAMAAYNVGKKKLKEGMLDEAMGLFEKGTTMNPDYSSNYSGIARVHEKKGDAVAAINGFFTYAEIATKEEKAKKVKDAWKRAKNVVLQSYKAKSYDEVIEIGALYLDKKQNASVHYYVGKSKVETGAKADAVEHFDSAIAMAEEAGEATDKYNYAKATTLEALGKTAEALETYKLVKDEKYKKQVDYKIQTLGSK